MSRLMTTTHIRGEQAPCAIHGPWGVTSFRQNVWWAGEAWPLYFWGSSTWFGLVLDRPFT
eukprot:1482633-Amphidinium_carterae.2